MTPRPVSSMDPEPLIPSFYAGKDIFISGGTGFMGKVLIERILSTCPDVGNLFLLIRNKKGQTAQMRFLQLKQSQIFGNLRDRYPYQLSKLCLLEGDVSKPCLGIQRDSLGQLDKVSIVFHGAASVKFDEPLGKAVAENVRSVQRVLELCDTLPNLEALVYVSTAYSNEDQAYIEERVYPVSIPPAVLCEMVEYVPEEITNSITAKLISPKINTYVYTKAVAENIVETHNKGVYSIAIFRPTIVISSKRDPYPGWVDSSNGAVAALLGIQKGVLHVVSLSEECIADMLPVDIAIDTMIAIAWEIAVDRPKETRVYNCSTNENPIYWRDFIRYMKKILPQYPINGSMWLSYAFQINNGIVVHAADLLLHKIPLYMAQFITKLLKIKTRINFITIYQLISSIRKVHQPFLKRQWSFVTDNVQRLHARLTPEDAAIYNLDPHSIDWDLQCRDLVLGIRHYLLREKPQDMDLALRKQKRMLYAHYGIISLVILLSSRWALRNVLTRDSIHATYRRLISNIAQCSRLLSI